MATRQLQEPIFDRSLRSVNFFNGRLLTAEDLSKEQAGSREERRRLGRALGDGIVYGLEVTITPGVDQVVSPSLTIAPGLAIDRRGQTLLLEETVDLSFEINPPRSGTAGISVFNVCRPPDADAYVAGAGLYLLTITSVEGREGRAMVSGLGNIEASCNTKYHVPGLQFRLTQLDLQPGDLNTPDLLRNRMAHRCFGSDQPSPYTDPFGPPPSAKTLIEGLRPNRLADCEVPLALVYWTSTGGLVFLDMWAVRRRATPHDSGTAWPGIVGERRTAVAEAIFLQFQDQLDDLRDDTLAANTLRARDHFRYLPPAGIIPLANARHRSGYDETVFFFNITRRETRHIEAARLEYLFRTSFSYPPLDLNSGVMVWIYQVRENAEAIRSSTINPPQPFLIYTTGHMPFLGDPHYDVNRWEFANYQ